MIYILYWKPTKFCIHKYHLLFLCTCTCSNQSTPIYHTVYIYMCTVCKRYKCNCLSYTNYKLTTVNREYFVSKIFRIFIFRMYKFSYVRTLLFTNTAYFHIPVNFRIFKFRTHTVIRKFL